MKLSVTQKNLGGGMQWTSSEVVLIKDRNGLVNISYGDYLVGIKSTNGQPLAKQDVNMVFGAFTYYNNWPPNPTYNKLHELDMIELSYWGYNHTGPCPFSGNTQFMCSGNAQFGVQPWEKTVNMHRITLDPNVKAIWLYMNWPGEKQAVTYKIFYKKTTIAQAKNKKGDISWITPAQDVPKNDKCARFHLNFYMQNATSKAKPSKGLPPGTGIPQSIYVTDFKYENLSKLGR